MPEGARCASTEIPGGIPTLEAPQFLLVTIDDCMTEESERDVRSLLDGTLRNPDGRPVPVTYFLSLEHCQQGVRSEAALVRQRYESGDEIAIHTRTHATSEHTTADAWRAEIDSVRTFLAEAGVRSEAVRGFRAPHTATNDALFRVLREMGFLYDSSIYEAPYWSQVSRGPAALIWPYTFDRWGPSFAERAQRCEQFQPQNRCPDGPVPGLWEIPIYQYVTHADPNTARHIGAFDPGNPYYNPVPPNEPEVRVTAAELEAILNLHFNARYNGNRAPMNFSFHPPTMADPRFQPAFRSILRAALGRGDVWAMTLQGLVEWIERPVPAAAMPAWYEAYCRRHRCPPAHPEPGAGA